MAKTKTNKQTTTKEGALKELRANEELLKLKRATMQHNTDKMAGIKRQMDEDQIECRALQARLATLNEHNEAKLATSTKRPDGRVVPRPHASAPHASAITNQSQDAWWMCLWKMSRIAIFCPELLQQVQRDTTDLEPDAELELDILSSALWEPLGDAGAATTIRTYLQSVKMHYEKGDQLPLQNTVHALVLLVTRRRRQQWATLLHEYQELPGGRYAQHHRVTEI
jgi:hypothetical protein